MKVMNPATGETIQEIEEDGEGSIGRKHRALSEGRRAWACRQIDDRIACLRRFRDLLEMNREDLAKTLASEVGKPIREARAEIGGAIVRTEFFLQHSKYLLEPRMVHEAAGAEGSPSTREVLSFEPLGVVAHVSAWNYPYLIAMNVLVPALIGGNVVLYKPSEYATLSGLRLQELLFDAGVPQDAFQAVVGGSAAGKALLDFPLDGFFFTGSYKTGRDLAAALAGRLIPTVFELGGKDPLYVTDDVEVGRAAADAVEGCFYNAGQSCCAVERVYVQEAVFEAFVKAFVVGVKGLKRGDPLDESTTLGPVTRPQQIPVLERQVADALKRGAMLVTGGGRAEGKGNFFEPTVLINVDHSMDLMKEETFGPLIGIQRVQNDSEALDLMADTDYGLTASVFSRTEERARAILEKLEVGTGYWNCCDRVSPWLPWSGRKHSGLGATLSFLGIQSFVRPKAYHLR